MSKIDKNNGHKTNLIQIKISIKNNIKFTWQLNINKSNKSKQIIPCYLSVPFFNCMYIYIYARRSHNRHYEPERRKRSRSKQERRRNDTNDYQGKCFYIQTILLPEVPTLFFVYDLIQTVEATITLSTQTSLLIDRQHMSTTMAISRQKEPISRRATIAVKMWVHKKPTLGS